MDEPQPDRLEDEGAIEAGLRLGKLERRSIFNWLKMRQQLPVPFSLPLVDRCS